MFGATAYQAGIRSSTEAIGDIASGHFVGNSVFMTGSNSIGIELVAKSSMHYGDAVLEGNLLASSGSGSDAGDIVLNASTASLMDPPYITGNVLQGTREIWAHGARNAYAVGGNRSGSDGVLQYVGSGAPGTTLPSAPPVGSTYQRTDASGSAFYVYEPAGWVLK